MRDTYAIAQAVAVRRQVYADKDAQSLGKLVVEIGEDPSGLRASSGLACAPPTARTQSGNRPSSSAAAWAVI